MLLFNDFLCFEPAKLQIISMSGKKKWFYAKNNSLVCSCLFGRECLILRPILLKQMRGPIHLYSAEKQSE